MRTGVLTPEECEKVFFSIGNGKVLRIEMTDGGDGISGDWGALGNARLLRTDSEEEAFATPEPTPAAPCPSLASASWAWRARNI